MDRSVRNAILIFAAGALLAGLTAYREARSDTLRQGYILRGSYESEPFEEDARVSTPDGVRSVTIPVAPRLYSEPEAAELLKQVEEELSAQLFSEQAPDRIEKALALPEDLRDGLIRAVWSSDRPEILGRDGSLGGGASPDGSAVRLTAELSLQNVTRTVTYPLTVYPETLGADEQFERDALASILDGEDRTSDRLLLPEEIGGANVRWFRTPSYTWLYLLLLSAAAAVLSVYARKSRLAQEARLAEEALMLDYPSLTGKLVLFLEAGMSSRSAVQRIAADYESSLQEGRPVRPGYREFVTLRQEMSRGITEAEAYRRLGLRATLPAYKTLSSLLIQNLTKGSRTLLAVLDKEARSAWEERRKRARIRGEQASLMLLLPMLMLLGIVLVIMIVPAFMTLF